MEARTNGLHSFAVMSLRIAPLRGNVMNTIMLYHKSPVRFVVSFESRCAPWVQMQIKALGRREPEYTSVLLGHVDVTEQFRSLVRGDKRHKL